MAGLLLLQEIPLPTLSLIVQFVIVELLPWQEIPELLSLNVQLVITGLLS
jgi:hypothetical protein